MLATVFAVLRFTESDYHFGIFELFLEIYKIIVYNYTTVNVNIYTFIVVGVGNTDTQYVETIPVVHDQPYDTIHN